MQKQFFTIFLLMLLLFTAFPVQATQTEERSFNEESIYYIMIDRFNNGDSQNDYEIDHSDPYAFHGGDFKGIVSKLDYIKDMGFTALLLNPIFDNGSEGYNGYQIENYNEVEEHYGTLEDFKNLVNTAHEKNMKIIVDLGLRNIPEEFEEARMVETARWWIEETKIDGYKIDIVDKIPPSFYQNLSETLHKEKENFFLIGQTKENLLLAGQENLQTNIGNDMKERLGIDYIFNSSLYDGITSFSVPDQAFGEMNIDGNNEQNNTFLKFMDTPDTVRFTYLSAEKNEHPGPRIKLALSFLYTTPGIPVVYYGTEIALNGAEPPTNSSLMNFRTDQDVVEYISSLAEVRAAIPALTKGTFELIKNESGMLIFKREYENQIVYVAINNTTKDHKFTIGHDEIDDSKELRGLLTDDVIRPKDQQFNIAIERDAAEVYLVQNSTKINYTLLIAVVLVPILMVGFLIVNKKKHGNNK